MGGDKGEGIKKRNFPIKKEGTKKKNPCIKDRIFSW